MGRIRSLAAQAAAIVISVMAIAFSLGGGSFASAHLVAGHSHSASHSTVIPPALSWTSLSLMNGWASSNHKYTSGDPRVSIQNGIVYLSGSLGQPNQGSSDFAILPSPFRPAHNMWVTVYTFGDTSGVLYIGRDGTMEAFSPASCSQGNAAQCFTSLAGVSYPKSS